MTTSRPLYPFWLIAFLGFPPGGLLAAIVIGQLSTPVQGFLGGLIAGAVIGLAQMLALRNRLTVNVNWIVATAVGLAAGVGLAVLIFGASNDLNTVLLRAPLTGLLLGLAQWSVLKQYTRRAAWWILALPLVFTLAWWVTAQVIGTSLNEGFIVFGASGALLHQALTGLVLNRMLRSEYRTLRT